MGEMRDELRLPVRQNCEHPHGRTIVNLYTALRGHLLLQERCIIDICPQIDAPDRPLGAPAHSE
eukprot:5322974-Pleurochrysis_carterae.AAC.1